MTGIYIFLLMLILPIIAQINVTSTFNKYSKAVQGDLQPIR